MLPSFVSKSDVLWYMADMTRRRIPLHRKYLYQSLIILPFTAPIALIPIVPNLPGFYCAYRAWSNWKAGIGAKTLQDLLEDDSLTPRASPFFDEIYPPNAYFSVSEYGKRGDELPILLGKESARKIGKYYESDELPVLIERAIMQIKGKAK
jgi:hypothetical protein